MKLADKKYLRTFLQFFDVAGIKSYNITYKRKLREKCPLMKFFLVLFSCIQTEHRNLWSKSPYSVQMQENTDQKKLRIWTLFAQWMYNIFSSY